MADTHQSQPAGKASSGARLAAKRAAKAARKAAKREPVPVLTENELASAVQHAGGVVSRYQWQVWGGLAALALIGTVVGTLAMHSNKTAREATAALAAGLGSAVAPIIPEADASGEQEVDQDTFPSLAARAKHALAQDQSTLESFSGTEAADWAQLALANAQLELAKYAEAETAYREALADGDGEPYLRIRALLGLGFSLEGQNDPTRAIEVFEEAAGLADGAYAPEAGLHVARMWTLKGEPDKAIQRLQDVLALIAERTKDQVGPKYETIEADAHQRLAALGAPQKKRGTGLTPELLEQLRGHLGQDGVPPTAGEQKGAQ